VQTWLRIEAHRCRPGPALPRTTGEFDESGFEFALVDCLAGKWGWIAWPASGECVRPLPRERGEGVGGATARSG
jgi:hypothetical protein